MIRKLKLFWSLDSLDRRMLLEALVLPGFIWLSFRTVGVPRTQALLRRWAGSGAVNRIADSLPAIHKARRAQRIIQRNTGIAGPCLVRSLTLWSMLLRRGLSTDLRVGFRRRDGAMQGHAWLEFAGAPINEALDEARSYVPHDKPVTFDLWRRIRRTLPGDNDSNGR